MAQYLREHLPEAMRRANPTCAVEHVALAAERAGSTLAQVLAVLGDGMFWLRAVDPKFDADKIAALIDKSPDKRGAPRSAVQPTKPTDYTGPTTGEREGHDTVLSARVAVTVKLYAPGPTLAPAVLDPSQVCV